MKTADSEPLYRNARYYDLQHKNFVEDIPFYLRQIRKYGEPVLELACGTGRITIPIAEEGIQITGLDISDSMLSRARSKAKEKGLNVEWVKADCRDFSLNNKFNLIFFPFNSIAHLHDSESIEACLSCVRNHLAQDGRFVIEVFNPNLKFLTRNPSKRYRTAKFPNPDGKGRIVITENNVYDDATQVNRIKWYYKIGDREDEIVAELNMRIFYPQELDALLHHNGFTVEAKFRNYDEMPFASGAEKQLTVCSVRR